MLKDNLLFLQIYFMAGYINNVNREINHLNKMIAGIENR